MIQRKIYAACLQARGKQGASRMTAPGQAGTNTTNAGAFVAFDVPGATITSPAAINPAGTVTGSFVDAGFLGHSFLRTSDGTITPFDPPGAICNPDTQIGCSGAVGITPGGTIVGSYVVGSLAIHGYLRAQNGTITVFDAPLSNFTNPTAINPAGAVTGFFADSAGEGHCFIRAPNGTFTTFDPLGAISTAVPTAIDPAGTVTGQFIDVRGVFHGFLRTSDGTTTAFDPPGSQFTNPVAINPAGTIVGDFGNSSGLHGFLRAPNGTFTVFDPPGSQFTNPRAINPAETVTGIFFPPDFFPIHGFLRTSDGTFTVFDAPGSLSTFPVAINPAGAVTGDFFPPDFFPNHGFVLRPKKMH
jgi:hypothetical protein